MSVESCSVEECPYQENERCTKEHHVDISIGYNQKTKKYEATVFCDFNFYENKKDRIKQRKEILNEN